MQLRNVVKITGQVLINELKVSKNFKNQNCIFGHLVIEVSDYSVVRVNIKRCEYTSNGTRYSKYDDLLKAIDLKSKASYGNEADKVQITSGTLEPRTFENKYGTKIETIEVRTNFISKAEGFKKHHSKFELEGYLEKIDENSVVIKRLDYNLMTEEFKLSANDSVLEVLKNRVGSIILVKGIIEKSVDVVKDGVHMVAIGASTDKLYIDEVNESLNNNEVNIKEFEWNITPIRDVIYPFS